MRTFAKAPHKQGQLNTGRALDLSAEGISRAKSWVGLAGEGFLEQGVWTELGRERLSLGWDRQGAQRHLASQRPHHSGTSQSLGAVPQSPGSMTCYPGNLPCLLGGDCPATRLPSPLGATWKWYRNVVWPWARSSPPGSWA